MIEIGQYYGIKQTGNSELNVLSRDRVYNIPYKMHMFMLSWDPILGITRYLEHLPFMENFLGAGHEVGGGRDANGGRSILMSSKVLQ